jgi:tRNA (guanine-N7-)-methyltransferase
MLDMPSPLSAQEMMIPPPPEGRMLDFPQVFGRSGIVELEIGSGKGTFLLNRARAHPERDFLGIEWANKIYRYAADRMARWGVPNVRMMRTDAAQLVSQHVPPGSLAMLHIYHPDPWPKKRHHKRRLIQPPFVEAAIRALAPGGRIAVQTDHAEYFEQIQSVIRAESALREAPFNVPEAGVVDGRIMTNYEIKYLREGRPIYQIAAEKIA